MHGCVCVSEYVCTGVCMSEHVCTGVCVSEHVCTGVCVCVCVCGGLGEAGDHHIQKLWRPLEDLKPLCGSIPRICPHALLPKSQFLSIN